MRVGAVEAVIADDRPHADVVPGPRPPCCSPSAPSALLVRRNSLVMFMCVELMLNAVNLTFVTFARMLNDIGGQASCSSCSWWPPPRSWSASASSWPSSGAAPAPPPTTSHIAEGLSRPCSTLAYLIPALPLAGFVVLLSLGRRARRPGGRLARHRCRSAASFVVAVGVFFALLGRPAERPRQVVRRSSPGSPSAASTSTSAFLADPLSITMCLFVTGVGALIHLYSIGYMHGRPERSRSSSST